MIAALRARPDLVIVLLAAYFLVNLLVRITLPNSLELDESQQVFFAQYLAAGYGTQPPFYNWTYYLVAKLFGSSVATLAILKDLMLFASYVLYYKAARLWVKEPLWAVIAVLGLLTIPQISFEAQRDLTHTVAVVFATSLFLYGMARTLTRGDLAAYAITGLALGIGLISKYNFALFGLAAIISLLVSPDGRKALFDRRLALTIIVAGIVVTPHAAWLSSHLYLATDHTLEKMTAGASTSKIGQIASGLLSLVLAVIGFSIVTILAYLLGFGRSMFNAARHPEGRSRILATLMLAAIAILILVVMVTDTTNIKDRWLTPFLMVLPLFLALCLEGAGVDPIRPFRRLLILCLAIMIAVPLALNLRITLAATFGHYEKLNVPYGPLARALEQSAMPAPAAILAAETHLAGNLRLQMPTVTLISPAVEGFDPPVVYSTDHPLLIVWRGKGERHPAVPDALTEWLAKRPQFSAAKIEPQWLDLPYHYGKAGEVYGFGYAVVVPLEQ